MANYGAISRTNYFKVTDEARYKELFSKLVGDEDEVHDFTKIQNGTNVHGFGSYSSIDYLDTDDEEEDPSYNFDYFLDELQKILPDDEVFIYTESGHEKLRYITGYSIVVTSKEIKCVDLQSEAISAARKLLNNPKFDTQMSY